MITSLCAPVRVLSFVIQSIYTFTATGTSHMLCDSSSSPFTLLLLFRCFSSCFKSARRSYRFCFLCLFTFSRCNHIKYARISGCNMCTPSEWMNVYVIYVARNHRAHRQLETIANTMCGMFGVIAKFYTMVTVNTQSGEVLCNLQFLPMQASDIIRSDWNGMYTK